MASEKIKILFYGTPDFSVPVLETLCANPLFEVIGVVTQPDRPSGRGNKITPSPVKAVALSKNIPLFQPEKIRKIELAFIEEVTSTVGVPDVAVVVAFGQILPRLTLAFPKHGSINIHASILPRWRGAAPIAWAIIEGDKETGVSIMQMDEGMDTGPVYEVRKFSLDTNETARTLHDKLSQLGAETINQLLQNIVTGKLIAQSQPSEGVTIASKITSANAKIDWTKPASSIERCIRAFSPYPGAFTTRSGKILKIFEAEIKSLKSPLSVSVKPGTIIWSDARSVEVLCGDNAALGLKVIQAEGRNKISITEFQKGSSLSQGELLE
jgi:methionyl-tRNA formyltransferase